MYVSILVITVKRSAISAFALQPKEDRKDTINKNDFKILKCILYSYYIYFITFNMSNYFVIVLTSESKLKYRAVKEAFTGYASTRGKKLLHIQHKMLISRNNHSIQGWIVQNCVLVILNRH